MTFVIVFLIVFGLGCLIVLVVMVVVVSCCVVCVLCFEFGF